MEKTINKNVIKQSPMPSITVVIPTLNAGSVLEKCLSSIASQDYPKSKIEIIIADGGSTDSTLSTAKKYMAKIIGNPLKTGEAGKAVAVKIAKNELVALIDSDNILPNNHWFLDMVAPFVDGNISVSEPLRYTYRKSDPYLTRYFALLGMNDPICLFIGNYDRYSYITNRWTDLKFKEEDKGHYLKVTLDHEPVPTIGANGTIIRRKVLQSVLNDSDYLFDIDILIKIIRSKGSIKIAKVKTGIIHTFVEADAGKFFRKQLRRINDMSFHKSKNNRETNWEKSFMSKIFLYAIECLLIFPILFQMFVGFTRKPDTAWFFHPVACYSTLFIYLYGWLLGKIKPRESNRKNWKQ